MICWRRSTFQIVNGRPEGTSFEFVHFSPITEAGVKETLPLNCFATKPHNWIGRTNDKLIWANIKEARYGDK